MDLDLVFLGTAGSMPTTDRSPTALLLRRGGDKLLFDCAEGTQRQMLRSSLGLIDLREVFLTHYHADHYLGVPSGLERGALQGGASVTLSDGRVITPDQVLGEPRPGRTVVIAGDTAPTPTVVEAARNADLLVHEATFLEDERERARE